MAIDIPAGYSSQTLRLVESLSARIALVSTELGISALALAGCIAEEFGDTQQRNYGAYFLDIAQDGITRLQAVAIGHSEILANYNKIYNDQAYAGVLLEPTTTDKLENLVLRDVGGLGRTWGTVTDFLKSLPLANPRYQ